MIERADHKADFTVIDNGIIEDKSLSSDAFRLLVFMLARSDSFEFSVNGLAYLLGWPSRKVARLVTELKRSGYIEQIARAGENGRFLPSVWVIHEAPVTAIRENRTAVEPQSGETAERSDRRADAPQSGQGVDIPNIDIYQIQNKTKDRYKRNTRVRAFIKPTVEEVAQYCQERNNGVDPQHFIDHYEANGWRVGKNPMKDWRATVRTWERYNYDKPRALPTAPKPSTGNEFLDLL